MRSEVLRVLIVGALAVWSDASAAPLSEDVERPYVDSVPGSLGTSDEYTQSVGDEVNIRQCSIMFINQIEVASVGSNA